MISTGWHGNRHAARRRRYHVVVVEPFSWCRNVLGGDLGTSVGTRYRVGARVVVWVCYGAAGGAPAISVWRLVAMVWLVGDDVAG